MKGKFNPNHPAIDIPGGVMWEFTHKGQEYRFRVDKMVKHLSDKDLEWYDHVWASIIIDAYNVGVFDGKEEVLRTPLKKILNLSSIGEN